VTTLKGKSKIKVHPKTILTGIEYLKGNSKLIRRVYRIASKLFEEKVSSFKRGETLPVFSKIT
jgi:hypothetical protein